MGMRSYQRRRGPGSTARGFALRCARDTGTALPPSSRGTPATKQSSLSHPRHGRVDCFASLAMTPPIPVIADASVIARSVSDAATQPESPAARSPGLLRFARNDEEVLIARSVSDEAIQKPHCRLDCFTALAMTANVLASF